jgi:cytoskeletal protein RodZ
VRIGEALAEARRQAGLTVAEVSRETRIRETIIRGIEGDDYTACGGDFYARGNIRSIAKVVGMDPEPLIQEYDAVYRAPGVLSVVSLDELLTPAQPATRPEPPAQPYQHARRRPSAWPRPARPRPNRTAAMGLALALGLALVFALGFVTYRFLFPSGPGPAASAPPAAGKPAGKHVVTQHQVASSSATPVPTPSPSAVTAPVRALTPVSVTAFGASGAGQGDNPQLAHLAADGNPATAWHSDWYTNARFGNLYPGTGLLLDMGHPVTITAARIALGRASGAGLRLGVGAAPSLARLPLVAGAGNAGGVVHLRLTTPAHGRYVLLWFTSLPTDPAGTFQVSVYGIRLEGRAR